MRYAKILVSVGLVLVFGAAQAQARSSRRPRKDWRKKIDKVRKAVTSSSTSSSKDGVYMGRAGDGEKPVDWMTDFDEAAKIAGEEKRGLMVLFTTEEMMQKSTLCRFAANSARRAVRNAKVVPVRLLPPARMSREGLSKEEIAKREEFFQKSVKRYRELVRKYAISSGPALVFTAPDAARVNGLVAPKRPTIETALGQLGELIEAHQKAMAKKDAAGKPVAAAKGAPAKGAPAPRKEDPPKRAEKRDPGGDEDDF